MTWRNPIRATYDWVLSWAERPGGPWVLAALAFAESSFFPIPPDILLIPLCLSVPRRAFWFAGLCTVGSVLGGIFGYAIGVLAFDSVGAWIVDFYGLNSGFDQVGNWYAEWAGLAVTIAGFTFIPYKVFTISAGVFRVNFAVFVVASVIGRGGRFFLVAGLLKLFGEEMKDFIDKYFNWLTLAAAALIVVGFAVIRLFLH